jgi:hypothetical protein
MTETCWFCKGNYEKGEGKSKKDLDIHLVHILDSTTTQSGSYIQTKTSYQKTTITVPRCPDCAKKTTAWGLKGAWICTGIGIVIGIIFAVLEGGHSKLGLSALLPVFAIGGFLIGFLFGTSIRNGFEQAGALRFPSIKELIETGWNVSKNP